MSDERKIVGYDIMTGDPIYEDAQPEVAAAPAAQPQQDFVGYDPMTGQPIYGHAQANEQAPTGFDPMTGQPIYGAAPVIAPAKPKKGGKVMLIIGAVIAAVVVLALVIVLGVKSGLFLSKGNKVAVATANTLSDAPKLVQDLEPLFKVTSGTGTLEGTFTYEDISVEGFVSLDKTEANAQVILNIEDIPEIDVAAQVNAKGIKAQSKALSDYTFVYNTADDKEDGFIAEMVGEDALEELDAALASIGEVQDTDKFAKDLTKIITDEYKELEFEKAKEKEFEVDGKDVKCKGYSVEITEDNIMNIVDGMEDILDEAYGEVLENVGMDAKDITEELEYAFEGMDDIELTFYLYKNKLAAIIFDVEGDKIEVEFQGGDYRMQNVVVSYDRNELIEIKGETEKSVETMEFVVYGREVFAYEYDTKSGDLEVEAAGGDLEISANIQSKGSSVTVALDKIYGTSYWTGIYGDSGEDKERVELDCVLTFKENAEKAKFSGKEFNVGTADEDEFEDLVDDIEDAIEDYEELYYYF